MKATTTKTVIAINEISADTDTMTMHLANIMTGNTIATIVTETTMTSITQTATIATGGRTEIATATSPGN
jgi:hypothetical protein